MSLRVSQLKAAFAAESATNLPGVTPSLKDLFGGPAGAGAAGGAGAGGAHAVAGAVVPQGQISPPYLHSGTESTNKSALFASDDDAAAANSQGPVTGMFVSSGDPTVTEICAGAGFDYLLIDGEHSPLSLETVQAQLRALAPYPTLGVVRVPVNDEVLIKQYLDLGAQSLVVPMVDTVGEAQAAARAVAYPPEGVRGVGSALARSGRWGRIPNYLMRARETITLIVQAESASAVKHAEGIAAVHGVDGVFIGPSDLAASMGLVGQQTHPDVVAAVKYVIATVKAAGKFVGVNAFAQDQAQDYIAAGADFVNVGADVTLLVQGTEALYKAFNGGAGQEVASSY